MDKYAVRTIDALNNVRRPQINDHFNRAEIIRYNMLDNMNLGTIVPQDNRNLANIALNGYMDAVLLAAELAIHHELENNQQPNMRFMIDRINELGRVFNQTLHIDQPVEFLIIMDDLLPTVAKESSENRQRSALQDTTTKIDAINTYFENSIVHTNDQQNSHDTMVNKDLNKTLDKIRQPDISITDMLYSARKMIAKSNLSDDQRTTALKTLNIISKGSSISTLNDTEDNIFAYVWNRTLIPENKKQKENMQEAILLALIDSIDKSGIPVCINGRCARLIGSLALLDSDKSVGQVMTIESYRNQIYHETNQIIEEEIQKAKQSNDEALRLAGKSYTDPSLEPQESSLDILKNNIKQRIDYNIDRYDDIDESNKKMIRDECYVSAIL
jgi:hypothetical protein